MSLPRKLTDAQVREARRCAAIRRVTPSAHQLAKLWNVSHHVVLSAAAGTTYKHLPHAPAQASA